MTDRYTIHAVDDIDCASYDPEVLASATTIEAAKELASEHSGATYGAAIRDTETGLIDYGFGFGVEVPEPDAE